MIYQFTVNENLVIYKENDVLKSHAREMNDENNTESVANDCFVEDKETSEKNTEKNICKL